jgi:hypothetical protein
MTSQSRLLRPTWQEVEGHAEDDVDGNDQSPEEPSGAAAVGDEGRSMAAITVIATALRQDCRSIGV